MADLVSPDVRFRDPVLVAMDEFTAEGATESQTAEWIEENARTWHDPAAFAAFVASLRDRAADQDPVADVDFSVPTSVFWGVEGNQYLGRIAVRHRLTDVLRRIGGHIGLQAPSLRMAGS